MIARSRALAVLVSLASLACMSHAEAPATTPSGARAGLAPRGFDAQLACVDWRRASSKTGDAYVDEHDSFPELAPAASCYTRVHFDGARVSADAPPPGCAWTAAAARDVLEQEAARYEAIAEGVAGVPLPAELSCRLDDRVRRAAAANNARTLRSLAQSDRVASFPYSAVVSFGYGNPRHGASPILRWTPGDACFALGKDDLDALGVNEDRAGRAALAFAGGVAPVVAFSGGAIHSPLVEAFMLDFLATCKLGVPADRVMLDPCADHTHTNVKNAGRLVAALGGRAAFLVTDDGLQAGYLEEWTFFDWIGGSIDQRALRDFHYLVGSWRRASDGIYGGYWFTPYRFLADRDLGDFRCVR